MKKKPDDPVQAKPPEDAEAEWEALERELFDEGDIETVDPDS